MREYKPIGYWEEKWDDSISDPAWNVLELLALYVGDYIEFKSLFTKLSMFAGPQLKNRLQKIKSRKEVYEAIYHFTDINGCYRFMPQFHEVKFILAIVKHGLSDQNIQENDSDLKQIFDLVFEKTKVNFDALDVDVIFDSFSSTLSETYDYQMQM